MRAIAQIILIGSLCVAVGWIVLSSERSYRRARAEEEMFRRSPLISSIIISTEPEPQPEPVHSAPSILPGRILPSVNLPVPFTSQAPLGDWAMPYREACEEASVVMALAYTGGSVSLSMSDANREILALAERNRSVLGDSVDESVAEVRDLLLELAPELKTTILRNPTPDELKQELSRGNILLVPASGKTLMNPHFVPPPPEYHMIVIRGYTEDGFFIVNEPGSREGEGHLYAFEIVMEAMGDLPEGEAGGKKKSLVVVRPDGGAGL
jgi:hypothetical protein